MKKIEGGLCAPQGFVAGAAMAAVKYEDKYDVAIISSRVDSKVAGMFTTNRIQAAPVIYSKQVVSRGAARAIVVNSGNANACTGPKGMEDCQAMAEAAALTVGVDPEQVVVASTGVIGVAMPMERVIQGVREAGNNLSEDGAHQTALAMMTTDTFAKEVAVEFSLAGKLVRLGGAAKGSGMIHPNMATMLAFVTTDVEIEGSLLQKALKEAVVASFNMITVDGDTSTNDSVVVLANGLAGNKPICLEGEDFSLFALALQEVCIELAQLVARDGEGATKFIEVKVTGAISLDAARRAAKGIAGSSLTKAAFYGEDANWGRIICALGYSIDDFEPEAVDIYLGSLPVAKGGAGLDFSEEEAKRILMEKDIKVRVELNQGEFSATAWGCDLSHEYVTINGSYRS